MNKDFLEFVFYFITALSTLVTAIVATVEAINNKKIIQAKIVLEYVNKKLNSVNIQFTNRTGEPLYPDFAYFFVTRHKKDWIDWRATRIEVVQPNQTVSFYSRASIYEEMLEKSSDSKIKLQGCVKLKDERKIITKVFTLEKKRFNL